MRQVSDWDMDDAYNSLLIFKSNRNFGLLVLLAIAFVQIIPWIEEVTGFKIPEISIDIMQLKTLIGMV